MLKTREVQTLRDSLASSNRAERLECGAFAAAFVRVEIVYHALLPGVDSLAPAHSALWAFASANSFRRFPNGSSLPKEQENGFPSH